MRGVSVGVGWVSLFSVAAAALGLAGCARTGPYEGCVEGMVVSCACPGGRSGVQTCLRTGTFGACRCDGLDAGSDVVAVDAPVDGGMVCTGLQLAVGCTAGRCSISAPLDSLGERAVVNLSEVPVPAEIAGDAIGPVLCRVTLLQASVPEPLRLTIATDEAIRDRAVLFSYDAPNARALDSSSRSDRSVTALVRVAGDYGLTERPSSWDIERVAGTDVRSTTTDALWLRNLSGRGIGGSFWDGRRLYVGSVGRIFVYDGLPVSPLARPAVVLGQPDLTSDISNISSSSFSSVSSLWSDGTRLVAVTGQRVLIWLRPPTTNFQPADLVLGQSDFSSDAANSGGISASRFSGPAQVESDGTSLWIAETGNHRFTSWRSFPTAIGQAATGVIGQPDFASAAIGNGATSIYQAVGSVVAPGGMFVAGAFSGVQFVRQLLETNPASEFSLIDWRLQVQPTTISETRGIAKVGASLAVSDRGGGRVMMYRALPSHRVPADFVLGQPDTTYTATFEVNASNVTQPGTLAGGADTLLAMDGARLLVWTHVPEYNFDPADRVVGQAGFTTNLPGIDYTGISSSTLGGPSSIAVSGDVVAVADRGNNRVLLYSLRAIESGSARASVVLGQRDDRSYVPNVDQRLPGAATMSGPAGVALDGARLIVADTENHRVLLWNRVPTTTGAPADIVLGQQDFRTTRPNRGRRDESPRDGYGDAGPDGVFSPTSVATDGTRLLVADRLNHRVLVWNTFPTRNGQPADAVLGQPDFTSNRPNAGRGAYSVVAEGFNLPTGLFIDGASVWVADTENNRVVRWTGLGARPTATAVLGQPDLSTVSNANCSSLQSPNPGLPASPPTTAQSVLRPRSVTRSGDTIFVAEAGSHRVHAFDAATLAPRGVVGQARDTVGVLNAGGIGPGSLALPLGVAATANRLLIADSQNNRVVSYDLPLAAGRPLARLIVGQSSVYANGFNQASQARGFILGGPRGVVLDGRDLIVADSEHHRVLQTTAPLEATPMVTRVLGQPDEALALPNRGGEPAARTLHTPHGLFADSSRIIVADTGNHRVLIFDRRTTAEDATLVLGQRDFSSNQVNGGRSPGADTLASPQGVYWDGARLFVADSGNHRVLVWNGFPTRSGQPADVVIGQASMTEVLGNRGAAGPSERSLTLPTAVRIVRGELLVVDSGNNRVLRFASVPSANNAAASAVIGQADLQSRVAAAVRTDVTRLAGPIDVVDDGVNLYVSERDVSRVTSYPLPLADRPASNAVFISAENGDSARRPSGLAVERTPLFTTRIYVGDTGSNRLLLLGSASRLR
jgi:NHL repeat